MRCMFHILTLDEYYKLNDNRASFPLIANNQASTVITAAHAQQGVKSPNQLPRKTTRSWADLDNSILKSDICSTIRVAI